MYDISILSKSPRVLEIRNFISTSEANAIISLGHENMQRSRIIRSSANAQKADSVDDQRTSSSSWLNTPELKSHPVVIAIEDRISDLLKNYLVMQMHSGQDDDENNRLTRSAPERENLQVLEYNEGEFYNLHFDLIESPSFVVSTNHKARTRAATLLIYLNTPEIGGETYFPRATESNPDGLRIKAETGKAILFWNVKGKLIFLVMM